MCMALQPDDYVAGTYRGHGHALAKGTTPSRWLPRCWGGPPASAAGRAGSMNVIDLKHGLVGCYGIVGGSIAAALGAAHVGQAPGPGGGGFFGDGATNQGYFHECLNMAAVLALPVVFVCENNLYGEFTPMAAATAGGDIAARARRLRGAVASRRRQRPVGGARAAAEAVARARAGDGPTLLECQTYRHYGHSKSDPATYRPEEEVERWLERDPLKLARARLLDEGVDRGADRGGRERDQRANRRRRSRARWPRRTRIPRSDARDGVQPVSDARVPGRHPRRARRGARARPRGDLLRRGRRRRRAACSRPRRVCFERFGPERVFDTPISELALAGAAYGAAVTGLRPVFEVMFGDFMALAMDSLVNQAAKFWYTQQRAGHGAAGGALGRGRRRALRRDPLPDPRHVVPGGPRPQDRVPVLARGGEGTAEGVDPRRQPGDLPRAQAALLGQGTAARAARSSRSGGPRSRARRRPDDRVGRQGRARRARRRRARWPTTASLSRWSTCARCARSTSRPCSGRSSRTNRLLAVEEGPRTGRLGGRVAGPSPRRPARPRRRLDRATDETPIPYSPTLEDAYIPDADAIVASVRSRAGVGVA